MERHICIRNPMEKCAFVDCFHWENVQPKGEAFQGHPYPQQKSYHCSLQFKILQKSMYRKKYYVPSKHWTSLRRQDIQDVTLNLLVLLK